MKSNALAIFIFSLLMYSCASYPQTREDQAKYHANEANKSIIKLGCSNAANEIDIALSLPTGDVNIRKLFAENEGAKHCYLLRLKEDIDGVKSAYQANLLFEKLTVARSAKIFSDVQIDDFFTRLNRVVSEGNKSGAIQFELSDKIDFFPELKCQEHQQLILERSIKTLQSDGSINRPIGALMDYVQRVGVDSPEGEKINSLLPSMNIRRNELDVVGKVFPSFAAARKEELTLSVFLQVKNGDRLLKEDLMETLRKRVRGIELVSSDGLKVITLVIERVRNDERTLPEQTQTIT